MVMPRGLSANVQPGSYGPVLLGAPAWPIAPDEFSLEREDLYLMTLAAIAHKDHPGGIEGDVLWVFETAPDDCFVRRQMNRDWRDLIWKRSNLVSESRTRSRPSASAKAKPARRGQRRFADGLSTTRIDEEQRVIPRERTNEQAIAVHRDSAKLFRENARVAGRAAVIF